MSGHDTHAAPGSRLKRWAAWVGAATIFVGALLEFTDLVTEAPGRLRKLCETVSLCRDEEQQPSPDQHRPVQRAEPAPGPPARSVWDIGITVCGAAESVVETVSRHLREAGFTGQRQPTYFAVRPERGDWIAKRSTVFHYHDAAVSSAEFARALLVQRTGWGFVAARGGGLGVVPGYEAQTLFVHVAGAGCQ
ncbi:MAG: hypothetical protein K2X49_24110 [Acetobacteraceae bacterium]|nr:hypothetical protein [Acetobacteraceae bacterium]